MLNINKRFALLGERFFSYTPATKLDNAKLIHVNPELSQLMGLSSLDQEVLCAIISGKTEVTGYPSIASIYAGHQFGYFVPELGDGRALLIAEHLGSDSTVWELQLKGAGKTPFSRMGDGRAVLRSSIREYLASYAMNKLGVKTTLALAIVHDSDAPVYREKVESAAIVLRVAPSFIRFGHFELFASRNQSNELKKLVEFVISNYYPHIDLDNQDFILEFIDEVAKNTAQLIASWQAVGFVHGVMNTDNMSIIGLTIDYGPYVFMDSFRPEYPYNHSDSEGRYTYAKQAYIGWWNLYRLAEALSLIYPDSEKLEQSLAIYADYYNQAYTKLMACKLGFNDISQFELNLSERLVKIIQDYQMDWTYTWRKLAFGENGKNELINIYNLGNDFSSWYLDWQTKLQNSSINYDTAKKIMLKTNPALILRNHLLQNAIMKAENGDYSEINNLFEAASTPFEEIAKFDYYYRLPPAWAEHIELSCSS